MTKASAVADFIRIKTDAALNTNFSVSYLSYFFFRLPCYSLVHAALQLSDGSASRRAALPLKMGNVVINVSTGGTSKKSTKIKLHLFMWKI